MTEASQQQPVPKLAEIGNMFVRQYYELLVKSSETAHNFYHAKAAFSRLSLATPSKNVVGHDKIKAHIAQSNSRNTKVAIESIDCQETIEGGIIVMVTGVAVSAEKVAQPFCQTFFLEQTAERSYLVRNDMLRILSPRLMNLGLEPDAPKVEQATAPTPTPVKVDAPVVAAAIPPQPSVSSEPAEAVKEEPQAPSSARKKTVPKDRKKAESKKEESVDEKAESKEPSGPPKPVSWASRVGGQNHSAAIVDATPASVQGEEEATATSAKAKRPERPTTRERRDTAVMADSLWVTGLPTPCDKEDIERAFAEYGKVKSVTTFGKKGFCYVDYESPESVDKALKAPSVMLNTFELQLERRHQGGRAGIGRVGGRGGAARGRDERPQGERPHRPERSERSAGDHPREERSGRDRAERYGRDDAGRVRSGRGRGELPLSSA